jgi:hypothetical protein
MNVCHDWALRSWILGWGPFATVVAPAALAARCAPTSKRPAIGIAGQTIGRLHRHD